MNDSDLDQILALQVAVARLGEKPFRFWWNSDIADIDGGADLLVRLVGKEIAPLTVIEALLLVAQQTEERLLSAIPAPPAYSLFCPEPALRTALHNRFRHFKSYPEDLPERLGFLVGPECREDDLLAAITHAVTGAIGAAAIGADGIETVAEGSIETRETSFGVELTCGAPAAAQIHCAAMLATVASRSPKGAYTLPYYREAPGA